MLREAVLIGVPRLVPGLPGVACVFLGSWRGRERGERRELFLHLVHELNTLLMVPGSVAFHEAPDERGSPLGASSQRRPEFCGGDDAFQCPVLLPALVDAKSPWDEELLGRCGSLHKALHHDGHLKEGALFAGPRHGRVWPDFWPALPEFHGQHPSSMRPPEDSRRVFLCFGKGFPFFPPLQ